MQNHVCNRCLFSLEIEIEMAEKQEYLGVKYFLLVLQDLP